MKRSWQPDELIEHWTLLPSELALLTQKTEPSRLGLAILLKFYQSERQFPLSKTEIAVQVVRYVAQQLKIDPNRFENYDFNGRTIKVHRATVRDFFGFREATLKDQEALRMWLKTQVLAYELKIESLLVAAKKRLHSFSIEPPTQERLEKLVRSTIQSFEENFFELIFQKLSLSTREKLDQLLSTSTDEYSEQEEENNVPNSPQQESTEPPFHSKNKSELTILKSDPRRIGLDSWTSEAAKLQQLRQLDLPSALFNGISPKVLEIYKQRVAVEPPRELRRHPEPRRYTLLAAFCWLRAMKITDNLVELLIQIVHRIGARAERKVEKELLEDFKKVNGKTGILFQLAEAAVENPEGTIKDVIYPVVGETTLKNLVREFKSTGIAYREKVYTIMKSSYSHHYRRMIPLLIKLLEFRSNNQIHRPVIEALVLLKKYADSREHYYDESETIPLDNIVKNNFSELILETQSDGSVKTNRINYEIAVLQALRDGLRCKEIWVKGANRYRNPEQDLPTDFEQHKEVYYQALSQPTDVEEFIKSLQQMMETELAQLDQGMSKNSSVKLLSKNNGWIRLSPFNALKEPTKLRHLKSEIEQRWSMTSLLDILKETDLQVNFTQHFKSLSSRESLAEKVLQKRLLICLYGLGTNTGIKGLSLKELGENYRDLLYVRRKFIHQPNLRNAIVEVINATFEARLPQRKG